MMSLSAETLSHRIQQIPQLPLAHLPTPLEALPRLSATLGGPTIYMKRDDLTGLAFGGNKTRQLEFLFADIQASGADVLVTGAYTQSNWCRQMTAAACKIGLSVSLVLVHGVKGPTRQGNLLLDELMGADITIVDIPHIEELQPHIEAKAEALRAAGKKPYIVAPLGLPILSLSAIGYVKAACELAQQLQTQAIKPHALYVAGSNMTPAGLAVGFKALDMRIPVVSIAPIRWNDPTAADISGLARATAKRLDLDLSFDDTDIQIETGYVGPEYGIVTDAAREAIRMTAECEGIFLDPVYSAKAMAALIDHIRGGRFSKEDSIVFLHTGGTPALFAYGEDVLA